MTVCLSVPGHVCHRHLPVSHQSHLPAGAHHCMTRTTLPATARRRRMREREREKEGEDKPVVKVSYMIVCFLSQL